jgi:pilus assembly protein CpaE
VAVSVTIVGPRDANLEEAVRSTGLKPVISWATDLAELAAMGAAQPNVVLVDLRGQTHVPAALSLLKRRHPSTGVVILASTLDPGLMLEAMRAGVNECVTHPIVQAELDAAFTRVVGKLAEAPSGPVFAFIGAKGGVGTTTTAVNVATALSKLSPARALLIDLHLAYGDASVFLGAEPRYSVLDALQNMHRFDETFFRSLVVHTGSGVDLLASASRPGSATVDSRQISALISFASGIYPYTVVDVPRSDAAALEALDQAATIVVVANQELATVRNAGRMAAVLRSRYTRAKIMTVVNRTDRRSEIGQDDIERAVGGPITHQVPSDYRRALEAMNKGRPLALDNHNTLAASFKLLARELAGVPDVPRSERKQTGLLGRLSGRK